MCEKDLNKEFVPEYFTWVTMEEQKKKEEKLEKIKKNYKKERKREKK